MEENYADGDLGVIFSQAVPLTLPIVSQLLHAKRGHADDEEGNDKARALLQSCRDQVDVLQEGSANEQAVQQLRNKRLRLRLDVDGDASNAHLANMYTDAEGNVVLPLQPQSSSSSQPLDVDGGVQRERLRPFEVVALSTLMPRTAEAAVVLVPSLVRYDVADLQDALNALEQ